MKKIMFYCQHVLGMGHLMRSLAILEGLRDYEVRFINGGEAIPGLNFPPGVEVVNLPPLKSEVDFTAIESVSGGDLADVKTLRRARLLDALERFRPDLVMIELFPFGRKQFAFELTPLLARIRTTMPETKVVCSLRDILVAKRDQERHETRVCALMNRYFDALLIHADPRFQRLEETFFKAEELRVPIRYTGYVAQSPQESCSPAEIAEREAIESVWAGQDGPLILVSIGGGRVGVELLEQAIAASDLLMAKQPHRMLIFTGPYLPDDQFDSLKARVSVRSHICLRRYTTHFLSYLQQAALSVSMAGYNTCMNILATGVRSLVLPFTGGGNAEQTIRAEKLAALGAVEVIRPDELQPGPLAEKMHRCLGAEPAAVSLDLDGVANTAAFAASCFAAPSAIPLPRAGLPAQTRARRSAFDSAIEALRRHLEDCAAAGRQLDLFVRDDDADVDEETLRHLLDITYSRCAPLNVAIIPGRLTDAGTLLLDHYKRFCPTLLELHQHGWRHVNHEAEGRKCEFGISRSFEQQFEDIASGRAKLEACFEERFFPAFTPPWNRCAETTYQVLDALDFRVLSKDAGAQPVSRYGFQEISVTLDVYRWRGGATFKDPEEIIEQLAAQIQTRRPIGLMLHHKVMDADAFAFVDRLLEVLGHHPAARFHTFSTLCQQDA